MTKENTSTGIDVKDIDPVSNTSVGTAVDGVAILNNSIRKTTSVIDMFEALSEDLNLVSRDELEGVSKLIIEHVSSNIENLKKQLKELQAN